MNPPVLLVDDHQPFSVALSTALMGDGYVPVEATDSWSALSFLYEGLRPAAVVLREGLGDEALLRALYALEVPVFVLADEVNADEDGDDLVVASLTGLVRLHAHPVPRQLAMMS